MSEWFEHGRRPLAVMATVVAACACTPQAGQVYAFPAEEIRQALRQLRTPPMVFGSAEPDLRVETNDPLTVIGIVSQGRDEMMRYTMTLVPMGDRATRVRIGLTGASSGRYGDVERNLAKNPAIARLYTVAMEENIAATLLRRPFQMTKIYPIMMAASAANMGSQMARLDEVHAAEQKRARDNIAKAYADEAAGRR